MSASKLIKLIEKKLGIRIETGIGDVLAHAQAMAIEIANIERKAKAEGWNKKRLQSALARVADTLKNEFARTMESVVQSGSVLGAMYAESGGDIDKVFVWQAMSGNICEDCQHRHGEKHTLQEWLELGIPGSGETVCGSNCQCVLVDEETARESAIRIVREKGPRGGRGKVVALQL